MKNKVTLIINEPQLGSYRVKELNGRFYIEKYAYRYKWWFFGEKVYLWCNTNYWGGFAQDQYPNCPPFRTLHEANKKIKEWTAVPTYHEINLKL